MGMVPITLSASLLGDRFAKSVEQPYGVASQADKSIGPAKTGVLTVRTSASVGSLTMASGHGIVTADVFDLFWVVDGVFGARRGVVAGTVAALVVPISGGVGDDLPAAASAITAMVPNEEIVNIDGDTVTLIAAKSDQPGFIQILDDTDAVVVAIGTRATGTDGYLWYDESGEANPLTGVTVGKILTSHYDSSSARAPKCVIAHD